MDSPICLSQNFVNKQNVRSFDNVLKSNLLKNADDGPFFKHIFGEDYLVSETPNIISNILTALKSNLREKSKEDFKSYFSALGKENGNLRAVNKQDIFACCWTALNEIIPSNFFGGNHNNKIFKKLAQCVIFSMRRQHTTLTKIIEKWDFSVSPWNSCGGSSKNILFKIILWINKYILSPMICLNFFVTTCKLDADEYKLHFFWKNQWQSFFDRKISDMIFSKTLKRFEPYYLSKKVKHNCHLSERLKLKSLKKDIPKLHLVLKPNNDCRPIVRYKNEQTSKEKYKIKDRLTFLKTLGEPHKRIETQFNNLYQQWLNSNKPKLYFVKTDLSNAFGLINREKMMKILNEKHVNLQQTEKSLYVKKKMAQQYKDIVTELRKPLLVRVGNTVYEWTEGLVQGYKYSPALSELYYGYLDNKYFSEHFKNSDCQIRLFIRVVDDYLYITDSLEDATSFLTALSSYRNVNYDKTFVNFVHDHIRCTEEITFLGYSYNTNNMQVSRASNIYVGQMCYKIAFSSSLENMNKFLENRIGQSGVPINGLIFNLHHNNEEIIWQHIFTTFCLSANKLCTILAVCESSKAKEEVQNYLLLYKKRVSVRLSNAIIDTLMRNKPADFMFMFCVNHFRYLSFKALYLCATKTPKCSGLVPLIKDELAKSNCIYGKWNDHACRIESNGDVRRKAIREICRRPDLRRIFKTYDVLPNGFQCYNQRK